MAYRTVSRIALLGALAIAPLVGHDAFAQAEGSRSGFGIDTDAKRAVLVEDETGTTILQKNADQRFEPASLAKLMTMEIVFEALNDGEITLDTEYPVSEHAWRTGGAPSGAATMFAAINSRIPVLDLVRGTIVQGANDGAIILAEGLSGSEKAFTERMNARAKDLGLTNTHFANPTGLSEDGTEQYTTASDLVKLARHIRSAHPELYKIYSEPAFKWNGIFQRNRNPILSEDTGGEGMATGYTDGSGYSLMGAATKDGRTFLLALSGLDSSAKRSNESKRLLDFGFDDLVEAKVLDGGTVVGEVPLFNGAQTSLPVRIGEPITILLPKDALENVKAKLRFDGPIIAPVTKDEEIGSIDIEVSGETVYSQPIFASASAPVGSFTDRAGGAIEELALGWTRSF